MYNFKKNNQKGFTLAELLIVIAIIAALVAIMIPTFGGQVERAREAADMANIRAAYAEVTVDFLENGYNATTPKSTVVPAKQTKAGWQSEGDDGTNAKEIEIGGNKVKASTSKWTVAISDADGKILITPAT